MSRRRYPEFPRVGIGAIVIREGRILLVQRAAWPNRNLWAIPGGMLELGETLQEGAEREILEETNVRIKAGKPIYTFDFMERDRDGKVVFHFVVVDLEGTYVTGEIGASDDALDVAWVSPGECAALALTENTVKILREIRFLEEGFVMKAR